MGLMKKLSLYVFLVLMVCNTATAKDLNGKKLYCKGVDNLFSQHVALVFIENYQVKLSYMYVYNEQVNKEAAIHQETFGYHAGEDTITFLTSSNKLLRAAGIRYGIKLDRINLNLYVPPRSLKCKIVNYDPLEKFKEKYKKLTTPKKVKKKI